MRLVQQRPVLGQQVGHRAGGVADVARPPSASGSARFFSPVISISKLLTVWSNSLLVPDRGVQHGVQVV